MAEHQWAPTRAAIITLLKTVSSIDLVTKAIPEVAVTGVHAVVLMVRGRHKQGGCSTRDEQHLPVIIIIVPIGGDPEGAENELDAVYDDLIALFNSNVDLGATVDHSNLQGYRAGWETIAGGKCRGLRLPLWCHWLQSEAYALSA